MKKIMIFICGEISKKCSANGCFRTFNEKIDAFAEYGDEEIQLVAFNTCSGCDQEPLENLQAKIPKFKKSGATTVHISTCIRGRCENYEAFAKILGEAGLEVIGYTHGSLGGKKENTLWVKDGEIRKYEKDSIFQKAKEGTE